MYRESPAPSQFGALEAGQRTQWSSEVSTREPETSKEVGMTPLFITKTHLWRSLSTKGRRVLWGSESRLKLWSRGSPRSVLSILQVAQDFSNDFGFGDESNDV